MRHVVKGESPQSFIEWKAQANPDWEPSYENLQNPQKRELHEALLAEQGAVCCYCGRSINYQSSHIEHFRPRETYPQLSLDYSNLFASCMRETTANHPLHCGHAKGSAFSEQFNISPLLEGCETRFIHTLAGRELAADTEDHAAKHMICTLKQNVAFLTRRRSEALAGVFDEDFIASATWDELQAIIHRYRSRDDADSFHDFAHVVAGYAERLLAVVTPGG